MDATLIVVFVNGLVQLVRLILLAVLTWRGQRELARMGRAVAGLVVQEEEKTRELLRQRG
ncbi:MAG: hypothetical protein HY726_00725 [Candidatus Rokubacteria bacterium]|nr:hypothetical protein [Candidatus Rokubacteria bacterium]